jgi:hypothetical protein
LKRNRWALKSSGSFVDKVGMNNSNAIVDCGKWWNELETQWEGATDSAARRIIEDNMKACEEESLRQMHEDQEGKIG